MPAYYAYGLRIESDLVLPELCSAPPGRPCDVRLRFRATGRLPSARQWVIKLSLDTGRTWLRCARVAGGYLLRFDGADVIVGAAGDLVACVASRVPRHDLSLRHLMLDQVLPLVLKLRGEEALHASAVRAGAGIVAFIGPGGSGKSTLAAAFLQAGQQVVSDDGLRLTRTPRGALAWPSYPGVRLCTDDRGTKARWAPDAARCKFLAAPGNLARIYRLMPGARHRTELGPPLSAREALVELATSTFRFDALDRGMLTREFRLWDHVARTVPMRRLWLEPDLTSSRARQLIVQDVGRGSTTLTEAPRLRDTARPRRSPRSR